MTDFAFLPEGNTVNVTTNATANTSSSQVVSFAVPVSSQPAAQASGLGIITPQIRIFNTSTSVVWVSITNVARTAAYPTAGAPSLEYPIAGGTAGASTSLTISIEPAPGTPFIYINTICATASAVLNVTFGEGR